MSLGLWLRIRKAPLVGGRRWPTAIFSRIQMVLQWEAIIFDNTGRLVLQWTRLIGRIRVVPGQQSHRVVATSGLGVALLRSPP